MYQSLKAYPALLCMVTLGAGPVLAQTWDPVRSDGMNNTAMGTGALANPNLDNDGGCHNTASGQDALEVDTSGSYNAATGFSALASNLTGDYNTGLGAEALFSNTSGSNNTASGYQALYANTTGGNNAAFGFEALLSNNGSDNTAAGYEALYKNEYGSYNTAFGEAALQQNLTGTNNTAVGNGALIANKGSHNTALGSNAGETLTTGTDNIDIANNGVAGESHTLRLGTQGKAGVVGSGILSTYIAGITGTKVTGSAVYITSSGELGTLASSERYKTDIEPMGTSSERIAELRPVSFRLKNDPSGTIQYGLIAEEVAKVYPELVIRGDDGQINGVRYEELAPMLLSEVQQQQKQLAAQASQLAAQTAQLAEINALKQQLAAQDAKFAEVEQVLAMLKSRAGDDRVAMR
jgi:hypothetical protein